MADPIESCYATFGRNLRRVRVRRKVTQQALAGAIGVSRATVANLEQGRQRVMVHDVIAYAAALGVSHTQLLRSVFNTVKG